ncbi:hypothetical protein E1B28_002632 [Marasmius oreades]|nr:uncharacterized protein E1B28_002632 [Marasmius oreades]KAG7086694.1 hypothetical protein E1B28_002632 [Marasmius oreades]
MDQSTSTSFNGPGHITQPSMEVDSMPTTDHLPTSGSTPSTLSSAAEGSSAPLVPAVVPDPSMAVDTVVLPLKRPSEHSLEHVAWRDPLMTIGAANDVGKFAFDYVHPEWPIATGSDRTHKRLFIAGPDQEKFDDQSLQAAADKVKTIYKDSDKAIAVPAFLEANLQAIYAAVDDHRRMIEDVVRPVVSSPSSGSSNAPLQNNLNQSLHEQNKVLEAEWIQLLQANLAHQTVRDKVLAEAAKVGLNAEKATQDANRLAEQLAQELAAVHEAAKKKDEAHRKQLEDLVCNALYKYGGNIFKLLVCKQFTKLQEENAKLARDVEKATQDTNRLAERRAQELAAAQEAAKKTDEAHRKQLDDLSMKLQEEKRLRTTAENERSTELNRNRQRQPRSQSSFPILNDNDADDEMSPPQPTSTLNSSTSHRRSSTHAKTSSTTTASAPFTSSPSTGNSAPRTTGGASSSSNGTSTGNSAPHTTEGTSSFSGTSSSSTTPSSTSSGPGPGAPPFPSNIPGDPAALVQEFLRYMASAPQGAMHTTTHHAPPTATPTHRNARRQRVVHTPRPGSNNHKKALKQKAKSEIPKKLHTLWDRMLRKTFLGCTAMECVSHFEEYNPIEDVVADAYKMGNGLGPEGDNQFGLFFGEGWNRHAWNRKVVDNLVLLVPAQKQKYTELAQCEISEEVLQTWFWVFIRDARGYWSRSRPRVHTSGSRLETRTEATVRAERYAADRARRVRVTNHKHNKYYRRLEGAINLLKEADSSPHVGEWQRAQNLLEQLDANAMSSECTDDEEVYGPSRVLVVSTPHFRRRCIGPLMKSLDEAIRTLPDVSYNTTPKTLPRSCYHNSFLQRLTPQELGELEVKNVTIPLFDRWAGRAMVSDTEDEDEDDMSVKGSGAEETCQSLRRTPHRIPRRRFEILDEEQILRVATDISKVNKDLQSFTIDATVGGDMNENNKLYKKAKERLDAAVVVFTTCAGEEFFSLAALWRMRMLMDGLAVGASLGILRKADFEIALIDEASQINGPTTLIPLVKGVRHAISDHVQLRPTVKPLGKILQFDVSLLKRLFTMDEEIQYRFPQELALSPLNEFYQGRLRSGIQDSESVLGILSRSKFPWPVNEQGIVVLTVFLECASEVDMGGRSKGNVGQVDVIEKVIKLLPTEKEIEAGGHEETGPSFAPALSDLKMSYRLTPNK